MTPSPARPAIGKGRGDYITTATGHRFYPADPRPEDICLEDIAIASSNLCRFTGHVRFHLSIAQHQLTTASLTPKEMRLIALLHDAPEVIVNDLATPVKRLLPAYQRLERNIWKRAIAPLFGLPDEIPAAVKHADAVALVSEAAVLCTPTPGEPPWWLDPRYPRQAARRITRWTPDKARRRYLEAFERYTAERRAGKPA